MNILERLKYLESEATRGPWDAVDFGVRTKNKIIAGQGFLFDPERADVSCTPEYAGVLCDPDDARLIAEMRNALPKLLAVVEAASNMDSLCTQPVVEVGGYRVCNECDHCKIQKALAALDQREVPK